MSISLSALVAIETGPFRETLSQRLRAAGVQEIEFTPSDDLIATTLRSKPDLGIVHLGSASEIGEKYCRTVRASCLLRTFPLLAVLDSAPTAAALNSARGLGVDDFISSSASPPEFLWRLQSLQRLGLDRRLLAAREPWEQFVTTCSDGIVICDPTGKITFANSAARTLFPPQFDDHSQFFNLFDAASQAELHQVVRSKAATSPSPLQVTLHQVSAGSRKAEVHLSRLTGDQLLWNIRLINPACAMDHNMIVSQRLDVLGQLTGGIAHDLNNVLNAVIGGTTLLELDASDSLRPQIHSILNTAKRGGDLLQQLLLFSRGSDVTPEPTDLNEIARECAAIAADTFPRNIEVRFRGPQHNRFPKIDANPAQLHQILMNLCVNARDGMPDGGQLTIATNRCHLSPEEVIAVDGAKVEGDYLTVEITDSGVGIPAEIRSRVFEPFFSTKPKGKGTGLGLPTVLRLMQLHGGFVTVDSSCKTGTSVKCYFPLSVRPKTTATVS